MICHFLEIQPGDPGTENRRYQCFSVDMFSLFVRCEAVFRLGIQGARGILVPQGFSQGLRLVDRLRMPMPEQSGPVTSPEFNLAEIRGP